MSKHNLGDCAASQAIIRLYVRSWPGFTSKLLHVGLVLRKATVGQVFLNLSFFSATLIPRTFIFIRVIWRWTLVSLEATFLYGRCLTPPQENETGEVSVPMH